MTDESYARASVAIALGGTLLAVCGLLLDLYLRWQWTVSVGGGMFPPLA